MVTPEVEPFIKEGGLADVLGALPRALASLGHDVRLVCPKYRCFRVRPDWEALPGVLYIPLGGVTTYARVWMARLPESDIPVYFIEYNSFFDRPGVYDEDNHPYPDNDRRFAFFVRAALELPRFLSWNPAVIHAHDWPTALSPVCLNVLPGDHPLARAGSVLTIHNLEHQGYADRSLLDFAGLPAWLYRPDGLEAMGAVNALKGAIYHANKITTVSPQYAREIQEPDGGFGLHHVLRFKAADLVGILNGIDHERWDPGRDVFLPVNYHRRNLRGKTLCRRALREDFGLEDDLSLPVVGVISRFQYQKGIDLVLDVAGRVLEEARVALVFLGSGNPELEGRIRSLESRFPERVGSWIGYDEGRARRLVAGADYLLLPSRFEPCGLVQMYGMRYGTPPIVRRVGGLAGTVSDLDESGDGTGLIFDEPTGEAVFQALVRASGIWYDQPDRYRKMQQNGMKKDFSWQTSARKYSQVYQWAWQARNPNGKP